MALKIDWRAQPFEEMNDKELAEKLGCCTATVRYHRAREGRGKPMGSRVDWDAVPFGEVPDAELARQLGYAVGTIRAYRLQHGIKFKAGRPKNEIDWDGQPLGEIPDAELAEKLKISTSTVAMERQKRKIPKHGNPDYRRGRQMDPDEKWDGLPLGEVPDRVIADQLGITRQRIEQIRKKRGISSFQSKEHERQGRALEEFGMVGKLPDAAVVELTGVSLSFVMRYRQKLGLKAIGNSKGIDWDDVGLGEKSDGEVSKATGMSHAVIARHRRKRGIPPAPGVAGVSKGIDWDAQPLGEKSDAELGRELGIAPLSVRAARIHRGIERFQPPGFPKKKRFSVEDHMYHRNSAAQGYVCGCGKHLDEHRFRSGWDKLTGKRGMPEKKGKK